MAHVAFTHSAPCGFLIVRTGCNSSDEADTVLVQTDYDYPGVAQNMGWDKGKTKTCDHSETDGTVDCSCGKTVTQFISEGLLFIEEHEGEEFDGLDEYMGER